MRNLVYENGKPVEIGDIVHVKNKPYTIHDFDSKSGFVYVKSMDDQPVFKPMFPAQIGARILNDHLHPIFAEALKCFP